MAADQIALPALDRSVVVPSGAMPDQSQGQADVALHKARPVFSATPSSIDLRLSLIDAGDRLRPVDPVAVADLAVSITEGSLAHPITVRPVDGRFILVVGAHRLAAFAALGRKTIPAQVRELSALEARQMEIDENLVRSNLTALDRLTFIAERVEVWAARNPDRVVLDASQPIKLRGRPPKAFLKLRKGAGYVPEMMGFAAETARDTGLSRQSVYRAVQAVAALDHDTRSRLQGTWIGKNDAVLRQLAGLGDAADRNAVVDLLLAGRTKNVAEAQALVAGVTRPAKTPEAGLQRDFERAFKAASPAQRAGMLHWLSGQKLPAGWTVASVAGAAS